VKVMFMLIYFLLFTKIMKSTILWEVFHWFRQNFTDLSEEHSAFFVRVDERQESRIFLAGYWLSSFFNSED
jgi:hypothetical protein